MSVPGLCVFYGTALAVVVVAWLLVGRAGRRLDALQRPGPGDRYVDAPGFPQPPRAERPDDEQS